MNPGDLVAMENYCGGPPGGMRCETALLIDVRISHVESVQTDSESYVDRDIYECSLMCKCGIFEEYYDRLELINGN